MRRDVNFSQGHERTIVKPKIVANLNVSNVYYIFYEHTEFTVMTILASEALFSISAKYLKYNL